MMNGNHEEYNLTITTYLLKARAKIKGCGLRSERSYNELCD